MALLDADASQRKLFSFAITDRASQDVQDVLDLGVRYGYLFQSIIGRKEGIGRAPLYILSRRLAPLFNLDPMGFAGYKFVQNQALELLMDHPEAARKARQRSKGADAAFDQISLNFDQGSGADA